MSASVHMDAWSAVVRCLLGLKDVGIADSTGESGIEWAVRTITELHARAVLVPGLRSRIEAVERERNEHWRRAEAAMDAGTAVGSELRKANEACTRLRAEVCEVDRLRSEASDECERVTTRIKRAKAILDGGCDV